MIPSMLRRVGRMVVALALVSASCGGAHPQPAVHLAAQCEITHTLQGDDTIEARVGRLDNTGWAVSLRITVRLASDAPRMTVHGLGRVTDHAGERHCQVIDAGADPGSPRFDEALCLDEFDSLADVLQDAEAAAHPGQTVTEDVQLRSVHRRRARSRVVTRTGFLEHAEVTRDPTGRVIRVVRTTDRGAHEDVRVAYPPRERERCLPRAE